MYQDLLLYARPQGTMQWEFTDDYSLFQGARWQQSIGGRRPDVLVVSQYYLAVPWYLDQLGRSAHVPDAAASIANRLWQNAGRMSDVRFGEAAKAASQQAMLLLVQDWLPARRVFWIPGNFSDWPQSDAARTAKKLDRLSEVLDYREMPPAKYTLLHPAARLTDEQRKQIMDWADATAQKLRAATPNE